MKKIFLYTLLGLLLAQAGFSEEVNATPDSTDVVAEKLDIQIDEMSEEAKAAKAAKAEEMKNDENIVVEEDVPSFYDKHLSKKLGLGLGFGVGGAELKGIYKVNKYLSTSLEYNYFSTDESFDDLGDEGENIKANGTFTISSFKALGHWHVFGGGFRLTGGYVRNLSDLKIDVSGDDIVLKEATSTEAAIKSNLKGNIVINTGDNLPYIGMGWGYGIDNRFALDLALGIQFIKKIKGSDLIDYDIKMESTALSSFVSDVATDLDDTNSEAYKELKANGLTDTQIDDVQDILTNNTEVKDAIASGDPFKLYDVLDAQGILDKFDVDKLSKATSSNDDGVLSSLPNPDDYMAEIEKDIDDAVKESGLGAIQDIFGFAPLPVASLGITVFLW
jgi:hypothetical protein